MPSTYKTPGVYIEEISTLPASIAQVETAIPAFIGFTQKAVKQGAGIDKVPTRIKSLLEYEEYFGKGETNLKVDVDLNVDNTVNKVTLGFKFALYNSMKLFFANGGGPCYIVSAGNYDTASSDYFTALEKALATLRKKDEPTLILFPDAVMLKGASKIKTGKLQQQALKQCNDLQDRFCIFDVFNGDQELNFEDLNGSDVPLAFRNKVGSQYLKYGAAYYPFIRTSLQFDFNYEKLGALTKNKVATTLAGVSSSNLTTTNYDRILVDDKSMFTLVNGVKSGDDYVLPYPVGGLLNIDRFKKDTRYTGFDLIPEEYNHSDQVNAENQIKARVEFLAEMVKGFVALNITDYVDEDGDSATSNFLLAKHADYINNTDSVLFEIIKKLHFYDKTYSIYGKLGKKTGGTPEAKVIDLGNILGSGVFPINGGTITYDLSSVTITNATITSSSIYGSGAGVDDEAKSINAAISSFATLRSLFIDIKNIFNAFEAEIELRKSNIEILLRESNIVYGRIANAVNKNGIILPSSAAVAGLYAAVDNERGVWVAPANRSLSGVIGPVINITAQDQADLNVDVTAGKSINAIRSFTGRGTLVWGARTLAGNSNEWRYIPVRRLFNMIEESVKKATEFVVFEPNDKNTWVRTKAMIENFLGQIWRAGGLAGAKAEHAYIVKVGLGETMSALDILEGRMIIEIHLAAVRPAEFIVLRFMHKLQES